MAFTPFTLRGLVGRTKALIGGGAQVQPEGVDSQSIRVGRYQELVGITALGANHYALADEGSAFVIGNATPGTGLATTAAPTTFSATTPFLILQNMEQLGGQSLFLDYIRLTTTAAGTGGTALHVTTVLEPSSVARYTSGATLIVNASGATGGQAVNPKSGAPAPTTVSAYVGPITATAATANARTLAPDLVLRSQIPVANDSYLIKFGGVEGAPGNSVSATTASQVVVAHAPVVLDPQSSFLLHLWLPAQSAASSYQIEVGGFLR